MLVLQAGSEKTWNKANRITTRISCRDAISTGLVVKWFNTQRLEWYAVSSVLGHHSYRMFLP